MSANILLFTLLIEIFLMLWQKKGGEKIEKDYLSRLADALRMTSGMMKKHDILQDNYIDMRQKYEALLESKLTKGR